MNVLDFISAARVFYLATVEGDQPRVRPMGFAMKYDGKLAFCTANPKKMFKQMKENQKIEICCIDAKMNTLRISGKVNFVTSEDSQKKAIEIMPDLAQMYAVGDGKFEIFSLDDMVIDCYGMSGKKRDIEF